MIYYKLLTPDREKSHFIQSKHTPVTQKKVIRSTVKLYCGAFVQSHGELDGRLFMAI